jgi:phosphohistidine phosphatase SixA
MKPRIIQLALVACFWLSMVPGSQTVHADEHPGTEELVVFLVRHAEKLTDPGEAGLSKAGKQRAQRLADWLIDAGISRIHSTNTDRTLQTAAPLADSLGARIEPYIPADLDSLVRKLQTAGGRHLVVGHSNTTPQVVGLLGGEPGAPIDEESEYDRLYIVTIAVSGDVTSVLLRY